MDLDLDIGSDLESNTTNGTCNSRMLQVQQAGILQTRRRRRSTTDLGRATRATCEYAPLARTSQPRCSSPSPLRHEAPVNDQSKHSSLCPDEYDEDEEQTPQPTCHLRHPDSPRRPGQRP